MVEHGRKNVAELLLLSLLVQRRAHLGMIPVCGVFFFKKKRLRACGARRLLLERVRLR